MDLPASGTGKPPGAQRGPHGNSDGGRGLDLYRTGSSRPRTFREAPFVRWIVLVEGRKLMHIGGATTRNSAHKLPAPLKATTRTDFAASDWGWSPSGKIFKFPNTKLQEKSPQAAESQYVRPIRRPERGSFPQLGVGLRTLPRAGTARGRRRRPGAGGLGAFLWCLELGDLEPF